MVPQPWIPYSPGVQSFPGRRSAHRLMAVVLSFDVDTSPRYTPRDLNADGKQETFCNIFVSDVTSAMCAAIPHVVDAEGETMPIGKGRELNANATVEWLHAHGARKGWLRVGEHLAQARACSGFPTVAVWANHTGIGHVAVVVPSRQGTVWVAQAGAKCFSRGSLTQAFGRLMPEFYTHE